MNNKGQNTIEYLLIFALVVVVILAALGPNGFMTQSVNRALEVSVNGIQNMAVSTEF
ncbi:MAG: class III signal peptide-containing protein [Candidatus Omnitrophica bacterium]|nr:class III signal peptide-containing protein [Candidatus Omnitrophota bacterium]MCA9406908.1 class III signal peptide-containing protein [Candidatus Omnitrophota bacterium]